MQFSSSKVVNLALLSIFLQDSIAFAPKVYQVTSNYYFAASSMRSGILQTPIDDDSVSTNRTTSIDDEMLIPKPKFSKAKWKKKRYLIMQDVQRKIQQNDPNAPKKAEEMVRRMLKLYENSGNDRDFRPTLQAYNLWIHALAKSNWENAGVLAEKVMDQMREEQIWPNAITYTSVMDAYARSNSPEQAEDVFFRLLGEAPSSGGTGVSPITCDTMLNAWAQQGTTDSAERAQLILYRLEEWQREDIRPSKISYSTVMNAWAKVGTPEAAEKAEALLRRMIKGGDNAKIIVPSPDTVAFNAAINAWATSKDPEAGSRALKLLDEMKNFAENEGLDSYPDIITYNTVLSAWSHSGRMDAAPQTERIVQGMEQTVKAKSSKKVPKPNTVTYNNIIHAWAKSTLPGSVPRAQKVLTYMIKSKRPEIFPDVISFTSVLDAWAKSKEPHKSAKTQALLDKLLEMYETTERPDLKPSQIPFNSVLNACAFSAMGTSMEEQREALEIAVSTYTNMKKVDVYPDTVTYGNMLKCVANLMPLGDVRNRMSLQIFNKCREEGLVGTLVWNEVRRAISSGLLAEEYRLKGSVSDMQLKDLPKSWRQRNRFDRNAPKSKDNNSTRPVKQQQQTGGVIVESIGESGRDL